MTSLDRPEAGPGGPPRGLMYVEVDFPLDGVEEFHDWYNNEHLPERAAIQGFITAERYASIEAGPRWLAVYELESAAVLDSEAYCLVKGARETAWTRRMMLPNRANFRRTIYELLWSLAGTGPAASVDGPAGLFTLRLRRGAASAEPPLLASEPAIQALLASPGVGRTRLYRDVDRPNDGLLLAALDGIWAVQSAEFRSAWRNLRAVLVERLVEAERGVQVRIV